MAIGTYSELQTAVANYLVRSDLTSRIPEFITLAEARLNREIRKRQAETDESLTGVVGSRFINLPSTFAEALSLWIVRDGEREKLEYQDPIQAEASALQGEPEYWGIDGTKVAFERPCDQAYSFVLRQLGKFALSDSATTNTLLTDAPDVYLFATLSEAGPFLRDAELTATFEAKYEAAKKALNSKDARAKGQQRLVTEVGALQFLGERDGYRINRGH